MAAAIEQQRPDVYIELVGEEDAPGTFDVLADGMMLWSKHETGEMPEHDAVLKMLPSPKS